ncbi:uncharacterized protein JN550_001956 [Neoarthrinium moseri]|uniref:uncharacterized protein n=1 Tax=Neoarthrinium moseri TaxID=1658444 RepID=UPI001FDE2481|nr:uncharacterized protein JN550_001956 [Neoarthrinium moseri]KAI1875670.1 hypothetical protein JN550_001956 [Neoarthrinium moseri]
MSGIVNKVKNAMHSDKSSHEAPEGTHGTHNSRVANAADPRIDSDRDHRAAPTTGHSAFTEGTHSRPHEGVGATGGYNTAEGVHGTHNSRVANAADPRIDSDRDHRGAPGSTIGGTHSTHTGTHGTSGLGSTGTHGVGSTGTHGTSAFGSSGAPEGTHGTHNSRVANAADPRFDSDRDHRAAPGSGLGSSGAHSGTHGTHGTAGHLAAAHDGPAPNTAGPHKSDMLNKVDPRVDSNLDGSKTVGGDKTHAGAGY